MTEFRVVGLDLSLTSSGLALLTVDSDRGECDIQSKTHKSSAAGNELLKRRSRLVKLSDKIINDVIAFDPHVVLVEGPSYGNTSGQHHDRSGLWWMTANRLLAESTAALMEVAPNTIKKYATGRGNAGKLDVVIAVTRRYAYVTFDTDDEADAIALAALGARLHRHPIEPMVPKPNLEALKSLTPMEVSVAQ